MVSRGIRTLGESLIDLPHPARLLLAAKELAALTTLRPGPPSAKAILLKCAKLTKDKSSGSSSLKHAINSIPQEWLSATLNPNSQVLELANTSDVCRTQTNGKRKQNGMVEQLLKKNRDTYRQADIRCRSGIPVLSRMSARS